MNKAIAYFARIAVCLVLLTPALGASAQNIVTIVADTPNGSVHLSAELYRPDTTAARAAVVVLHGCGGVGRTHRAWGETFAGWGYVALVLDSFGGRDVKETCTGRQSVGARLRAWDAAAAVTWLRHQSFVQPQRVALQGHSHGAAAVLFAALREVGDGGTSRPPPAPGFRAAIAFYPDCTLRGRTARSFESLVPVQILIGEQDDWTPADKCRDLLTRVGGGPVGLTAYPGAHHGFDAVGSRPRYREDVRNRHKPGGCCGAWVGFNEPAYRDALQRVEGFLKTELGGPS
jgi:dienelactone hydrolase